GGNHQTRLLQLLGDAAALGPVVGRADPEALLPVAYAFAQEVYPDLLREEVNAMPGWLAWLVGMPRYTRHWRGALAALYRSKWTWWWWGTAVLPLALMAANVALALTGNAPEWTRSLFGALLFFGGPVLVVGAWLVFLFSLLVSGKHRKHARWRKRLA